MPACLATPVLQVDTNVIHQVDTQNPDSLFSMWTVFAKCAGSVNQGRRLENLSWRLWTRETICSDETEQPNYLRLPKQIRRQRRSSPTELPELSSSLDSAADEEAVEFYSETPALEIARPVIRRQDSCASSRSRKERHITSDDLEKMVSSIVQGKECLNAPLPDLVDSCLLRVKEAEVCHPRMDRSGSTTSEESDDDSTDAPSPDSTHQQSPPQAEMASSQTHPTIVVRGFSPPTAPLCRITSQTQRAPSPSAIPEPKAAPAAQLVQPKGRQARFALGASSGDDSYSDRESLATKSKAVPPPAKKPVFQVGVSSEENTPDSNSNDRNGQQLPDYRDSAIESDDEDDAVFDESAIDDDDESSDWEDSNEESGKSSVDSKLNFKRVDSTANLTSRRSLITLMLSQNDNQMHRNPRGIASQSTSALPQRARTSPNGPIVSPNDSDEAPLMMKRGPRVSALKAINEVPRSPAMPIMTTTNGIAHQTTSSPRTTRRNMMATELTESLRRNLLWERSHKNATLNAVLKRRHTSHDVANLKQFPGQNNLKEQQPKVYMKDNLEVTSWGSPNNYYEQGW
ncbi:hypothetical protein GE09DRAFT_726365 [Coniochaeta sp. 2T2.1]|nr:hypothetical protein GE09DRAFT_726365 [Coniochaeta sp. 2T2.1]